MTGVQAQVAAFGGSLTLIGLHAFGVYLLPQTASGDWAFLKRSWGFHFLTFYPPSVALSCYIIAIAIAVPHINQKAARWIEMVVAAISGFVGDRRLFYPGLCMLFWAIFYLGRQKYGFLGDGYVPANSVAEGDIPFGRAGTFYLLVLLHGLLGDYDESGVLTLRLFSIFWGGLYVVLVCLWAGYICNRRFEKVLCAALMVLIGPVQYFFGYIEIYAPLPVFVLAFLLSGITALRNDRPPLWATAFFGAGAFMHILLIFLAPALLCLWEFYLFRRSSIFRDRRILAFVAAAGGVCAYFFGRHHASYLLPLFSSSDHTYAILSWRHLWEWINAQVLSAPMGWPLLFVSVFANSRLFRREMGFLGAGALGAMAVLFVIDPVLGSRDWDILCLSGIPLMGLATCAFYNCGLKRFIRNYVSVFSCACAAMLVIPWVHINHTDRSIGRIAEILEDDPASFYATHPAEMMLGMFFQGAGSDSLAQRYYETALQKYPLDRRMPYNLGHSLLRNGDVDKSIYYFLQALAIDPGYQKALGNLTAILLNSPAYIASIEEYFYSQHSTAGAAEEKLADFWSRLGSQVSHAVDELEPDVGELEPDEVVSRLGNLGAAFVKKGDIKSAIPFFEKALLIAPENERIVEVLALLHVKQKNTDRAVEILRQGLAASPGNRKLLDLLEKLE